ncbi:MAG: ABC transporter permease [Erysipelotrichaceae bacterium]|jgi:simple sugar transport system permease protein|nr:ABC transporter permease [Erysipelotrichaceae bacterium]
MNSAYFLSIFNSILRMTTPILYATLGCLLCSRVNVFNIALEGQMLMGCFVSIAINYTTHNIFLSVIGGILAGAAVGLIVGIFQVKLKAKDMIVGTSLNLLITSLTSYLLYVFFATRGSLTSNEMVGLHRIPNLPESMTVLHQMFKNLTYLDIFGYILAIVIFVFLFKTVPGFHFLSVGLNKEATESLGTKADRIQVIAVVLSGALCGLGGVVLSMSNVIIFTEGMTAGRGYMAMAASSLAGAHPLLAIISSLFFGAAVASSIALQSYINGQITLALPYILTILIMSVSGYLGYRKAHKKGNRS